MPDEEEQNGKLLAGLCYVPISPINLVAILYVLLANKGGKYARFHAVQSMLLILVFSIISLLIQLPFMLAFAKLFTNFPFSPADFQAAWAQAFAFMVPLMVFGIVFFLVFFYFAIQAFQGKSFRIPVITDLAGRVVK